MGGKESMKIRLNSPVVLSFVTACAGAFLCSYLTAGEANRLLFSIYRSSLWDPLGYVRLIGHVFGHVDWEHFSGNMVMVLLLGPLLEEKHGGRKLAKVMVLVAILTGLLHLLLFPHTVLLGASGIVYAFIILSSMTGMKKSGIPLTFLLIAAIYLGGQIYQGIFIDDHTANLAHIAGGVIGGIYGCRVEQKRIPGQRRGLHGQRML